MEKSRIAIKIRQGSIHQALKTYRYLKFYELFVIENQGWLPVQDNLWRHSSSIMLLNYSTICRRKLRQASMILYLGESKGWRLQSVALGTFLCHMDSRILNSVQQPMESGVPKSSIPGLTLNRHVEPLWQSAWVRNLGSGMVHITVCFCDS